MQENSQEFKRIQKNLTDVNGIQLTSMKFQIIRSNLKWIHGKRLILNCQHSRFNNFKFKTFKISQ